MKKVIPVLILAAIALSTQQVQAQSRPSVNVPPDYTPREGDYSTMDGVLHRGKGPKSKRIGRNQGSRSAPVQITTGRPNNFNVQVTPSAFEPKPASGGGYEPILNNCFGGNPDRYADAIVEKLRMGLQLTNPEAAREFAAHYPEAINNAISRQEGDSAQIGRGLSTGDPASYLINPRDIPDGPYSASINIRDMARELRRAGFWIGRGDNWYPSNVINLHHLYTNRQITCQIWNTYGRANRDWDRQSGRVRNPQ